MSGPIPILLYHRVDRSGGPYTTAPDVFESHLAWLADHGYRTLTLSELDRALSAPAGGLRGTGEGAGRRTGRAVVLTFDDGFADLETIVAPALRRHDFSAAAFLITGRCPAEAAPGQEHLAWPAARALASEGRIELHSHSHSHQRWSLASAGREVADDLATSLSVLAAELRRPMSSFEHLAWPYGRSCEAWETAAHDLGLRVQYSVQRGAVVRRDQCRRLPRLLVDGMPVGELGRWVMLLSRWPSALACNKVFGTVRQLRQGTSYR